MQVHHAYTIYLLTQVPIWIPIWKKICAFHVSSEQSRKRNTNNFSTHVCNFVEESDSESTVPVDCDICGTTQKDHMCVCLCMCAQLEIVCKNLLCPHVSKEHMWWFSSNSKSVLIWNVNSRLSFATQTCVCLNECVYSVAALRTVRCEHVLERPMCQIASYSKRNVKK